MTTPHYIAGCLCPRTETTVLPPARPGGNSPPNSSLINTEQSIAARRSKPCSDRHIDVSVADRCDVSVADVSVADRCEVSVADVPVADVVQSIAARLVPPEPKPLFCRLQGLGLTPSQTPAQTLTPSTPSSQSRRGSSRRASISPERLANRRTLHPKPGVPR